MAIQIVQPGSKLDDQVKTHISESIEQNAKRWALTGSWILISVVFGYIISTVWDLNGKIYEVAGKQSIQYEVIDELKDKIKELDKENETLKANNYKLENKTSELRNKVEILKSKNIQLTNGELK